MKIELEKLFISFNGPPPHFWPISRSRPSDPYAPAPSPQPSPRPRAVFLLPRARRRVRLRQACRAAWRAHASDAGRVASRGPREHAPRPFSSPSSSASPSIPHFPLPRCISPSPRPRHRSSAGEIGRRWSTVTHNRAHITPPRSLTPGARCRVII